MNNRQSAIGVLLSDSSDHEAMKPGIELIEAWGIPYEIGILSTAHSPDEVVRWADSAEKRGMEVIIVAGGADRLLSYAIAAGSRIPIISVPLATEAGSATVSPPIVEQTTPGIPVATVGVNAAENASLLALQILGRIDDRILERLDEYREALRRRATQQNAQLQILRPGAEWLSRAASRRTEQTEDLREEKIVFEGAPLAGNAEEETAIRVTEEEWQRELENAQETKIEFVDSSISPAHSRLKGIESSGGIQLPGGGRIKIEDEILPIELVEQAVDCVLEGGIIAIPTETVYGLAADATNEQAINRLFAIKERSPSKSLAMFLDSQKALGSIVKASSPDLKHMLEAFWPGPLTVIFEKLGRGFQHVAPGETLGVRIPDHATPLMIMQELRRPMACTSANIAGKPEATSAEEIEDYFGRNVDMILDAGKLPEGLPSTVVDVTQVPFRILRTGAISAEQLAAVVGDLIQID